MAEVNGSAKREHFVIFRGLSLGRLVVFFPLQKRPWKRNKRESLPSTRRKKKESKKKENVFGGSSNILFRSVLSPSLPGPFYSQVPFLPHFHRRSIRIETLQTSILKPQSRWMPPPRENQSRSLGSTEPRVLKNGQTMGKEPFYHSKATARNAAWARYRQRKGAMGRKNWRGIALSSHPSHISLHRTGPISLCFHLPHKMG